jgi:hypothetical protein
MAQRRNLVRRYVGNSDRVIALPDNSDASPSPRRGDYDDYDRKAPIAPPRPPELTIEERLIVPPSRVECPHCQRLVRYSEARQHYYSHTLPGSTETCPQSGRM